MPDQQCDPVFPRNSADLCAGKAANWGLLFAIVALGLGTSVFVIVRLGWRHLMTVIATTAVILIVMTA